MGAMPTGDYAMLSAKPLMGYKCMACDRPLEKLDLKPGPHIPHNKLVPYNAKKGERGSAPNTPPGLDSQPVENRGPQHWYEDVYGPPAADLPVQDVGPILPPGGWKTKPSYMDSRRTKAPSVSKSEASLPVLRQAKPQKTA
eukprot:evm.model.scf_224.6 EVM.evm.TU.scf_224.6   scf_224:58567-59118(+)